MCHSRRRPIGCDYPGQVEDLEGPGNGEHQTCGDDISKERDFDVQDFFKSGAAVDFSGFKYVVGDIAKSRYKDHEIKTHILPQDRDGYHPKGRFLRKPHHGFLRIPLKDLVKHSPVVVIKNVEHKADIVRGFKLHETRKIIQTVEDVDNKGIIQKHRHYCDGGS